MTGLLPSWSRNLLKVMIFLQGLRVDLSFPNSTSFLPTEWSFPSKLWVSDLKLHKASVKSVFFKWGMMINQTSLLSFEPLGSLKSGHKQNDGDQETSSLISWLNKESNMECRFFVLEWESSFRTKLLQIGRWW